MEKFDLVYDGYSAALYLKDLTGETGLCINSSDVQNSNSSLWSENGCGALSIDFTNVTDDCTTAHQSCMLMNNTLFSACHSLIDPARLMGICQEDVCKYPLKDGYDCAFLQAYASACSMFNITLSQWRTTASCATNVSLCQETYCSDHEFCGQHNLNEVCLCRVGFNASVNSTLGESTMCYNNSASLNLATCLLAEKGINYEELRLNDLNCTGQLDPVTHMLLFGFDSGNMCGTNITVQGDQLIYENKVVLTNNSGSIITRHDQFEVKFSCNYNQPDTRTVALKIRDSSVVETVVAGNWSYNLTMKAYKDSTRTQAITPNTTLQLKEPVWVELTAEGVDQNTVSLVTDNCWGTSQKLANSTPKYYLIKNGCPNVNDSTVTVHGNGVGISNYFSFQMFQFTGVSTDVYLHCSASLCVTANNCTQTCGGVRRRRSLYKTRDPGLITMSWSN
ncbi:hypothetical protein NQD34_002245 [Periophthalmus magnuspinnatus]|nr:hypothetical protein NQD34_002245 [Periophthalmus magnuspinnatus]